MSGTITRIGATGAGALLAIGLFATPPAGAKSSDRSGRGERPQTAACFDETGKTQGRSHSDPDGMANGGFDKPGCTGGFDSDRDGNNGCGNDADREDDNNGHCGRGRAREAGRTSPTTSSTTTSTTVPVIDDGDLSAESAGTTTVAGSSTDVAAGGAAADTADSADTATTGAPADTVGTEVLGETMERPSALPRTGAGVAGLALLGGLLCGGGRVALLARRLLRIG